VGWPPPTCLLPSPYPTAVNGEDCPRVLSAFSRSKSPTGGNVAGVIPAGALSSTITAMSLPFWAGFPLYSGFCSMVPWMYGPSALFVLNVTRTSVV
jgi:hypothetical protein